MDVILVRLVRPLIMGAVISERGLSGGAIILSSGEGWGKVLLPSGPEATSCFMGPRILRNRLTLL